MCFRGHVVVVGLFMLTMVALYSIGNRRLFRIVLLSPIRLCQNPPAETNERT